MKISVKDKEKLNRLYLKYNHRRFVHPDPLEFLYSYNNVLDREIVGLISSSLAYGRVSQILKSVSFVIDKMMPSPYLFLKKSSPGLIRYTFSNFCHRFTTGEELYFLLYNIKRIIEKFGSLNLCFKRGLRKSNGTIIAAIINFLEELGAKDYGSYNSLLPLPSGRSAFKRMNLFLRWMVRKDNVDPGGWNNIPASKLVVPLDTHMYKICFGLDFTRRRQIDIATALEITDVFKKISPYDPVKYDFALTRLGIGKIYPQYKEILDEMKREE